MKLFYIFALLLLSSTLSCTKNLSKDSKSTAPTLFSYDFTSNQFYIINGQKYFYEDMHAELGTLQISHNRLVERRNFLYQLLGFRWPRAIQRSGELSIVTPRLGEVLFSQKLSAEQHREWLSSPLKIKKQHETERGRAKLSYYGKKFDVKSFQYGYFPIPAKINERLQKTFRYCIKNQDSKSRINICSPYQRVNSTGRITAVKKQFINRETVALNKKRGPLKGELKLSEKEKITFSVWKKNGFVLGLEGQFINSQIEEIFSKKQTQQKL